MTDWIGWHDAYDDPTSPLARRLLVVRRRLAAALHDLPRSGPVRLLSLCAGDGRDVIPVLAGLAAPRAVQALLVELDPVLADRARESARRTGLDGIEVRCADAGVRFSFDDILPVDVLLLCGVLGNVEHAQATRIVAALPHLLAPGGRVIWTRGGSPPDRRDDVRRWFVRSGLAERSFDGAPESFGVGVNERPVAGLAPPGILPDRLFAFVGG